MEVCFDQSWPLLWRFCCECEDVLSRWFWLKSTRHQLSLTHPLPTFMAHVVIKSDILRLSAAAPLSYFCLASTFPSSTSSPRILSCSPNLPSPIHPSPIPFPPFHFPFHLVSSLDRIPNSLTPSAPQSSSTPQTHVMTSFLNDECILTAALSQQCSPPAVFHKQTFLTLIIIIATV